MKISSNKSSVQKNEKSQNIYTGALKMPTHSVNTQNIRGKSKENYGYDNRINQTFDGNYPINLNLNGRSNSSIKLIKQNLLSECDHNNTINTISDDRLRKVLYFKVCIRIILYQIEACY